MQKVKAFCIDFFYLEGNTESRLVRFLVYCIKDTLNENGDYYKECLLQVVAGEDNIINLITIIE